MERPFFSVIIPTYNRSQIILSAINSVLAQTFSEFEIVIADDGSTDNTRETVANIGDMRLIYCYQDNAGVSQARNSGAALAKGKYLIFLDSDDQLTPGYLLALKDEFSQKDFAIGFGYARYYDLQGKEIVHVKPEKGRDLYGPKLAGAFSVSSDLFKAVGGYDKDLYYSENTEFLLRLMLRKNITEDSICLIHNEGVIVNYRDSRERFNAYSKLKYRSIGYFLKKHEDYFKKSILEFVNYKTIYALGAFQNGERNEAVNSIIEVIKKKPLRVKAYFQYLLFTFPTLARLYWKDKKS